MNGVHLRGLEGTNPLGFLAAYLGSVLSTEPTAESKYVELTVRANTGLGAEKAG